MQVVMRSGGGIFGEDSSSHSMGFQEFCDALLEMASRKSTREGDGMGFQEFCDALLEMASRKSAREGDGVGSVAPRLVELLESLPEETITLSEQSDAPAATLRKAATAASCVAKVRRATHDGNRLSPPP